MDCGRALLIGQGVAAACHHEARGSPPHATTRPGNRRHRPPKHMLDHTGAHFGMTRSSVARRWMPGQTDSAPVGQTATLAMARLRCRKSHPVSRRHVPATIVSPNALSLALAMCFSSQLVMRAVSVVIVRTASLARVHDGQMATRPCGHDALVASPRLLGCAPL